MIIEKEAWNATYLIIHDHHLITGLRVITLGKVRLTEIHYILISKVQNKPFSNACFENLFNTNNIDWAAIYMLSRLDMYNTCMESSQDKM